MPINLCAAAFNELWAIHPVALSAMLDHAATVAIARREKMPKVSGTVAIMPLHGMISQRHSMWQEIFGGTSTEKFGASFVRAVNDDRIKAIVLDVDSPGGTVAGVEELAAIVHRGAQLKPVAAISNSSMGSAAYWIASQANKGRLLAAPGSDTGSIGVFRMHENVAGALEQEGVSVEFIAVPEYKVEGNPYQPLTDEAREHNLQQVQQTYAAFVRDVARGRSVTAKRVEESYGKGRTFHATQAAEMGLVDGVGTLGDILAKFGVGTKATAEYAAIDGTLTAELCEAWNLGKPEAMRAPMSASESRRRRLSRLAS